MDPSPTPPTASRTPVITITATATVIPLVDWFQVYFTNPDDPHASDYTGGPDEYLAAAIQQARLTLDIAIYSLNLWSIRDAILAAWHRGVNVRMVMDSDNMDNEEVQELVAAGIPIIGDRREGLMHNKFVIIDREVVWTGSMNFTVGSAYKDENNLIRIRSAKVVENYMHEFEEMFIQDKFGTEGVADTPHPSLEINGTYLDFLFSPDDGVAAYINDVLNSAQQSIYFMAYSFTSNELSALILERASVGVTVSGVMDGGQVSSGVGSEYDAFKQAGLDIRLDGNRGLMHHKVIIIDRGIVITGSYNFTASAEDRNDENLIVIHNPEVAEKFIVEFMRIYSHAQP